MVSIESTGAAAFHTVEPTSDALVRSRRYREPGHLTTLECHELPARYRRVRFAPRFVPPATELGMLAIQYELQRLLGGIAQAGILGHAVRFAERDRGNAVAIESHELSFAREQVTVGLLSFDEPLESAGDRLLVLAGLVRVACSEEREQGQARAGGRGLEAAQAIALVPFALLGEIVDAPGAVGRLMLGEPGDSHFDRAFCFGSSAQGAGGFLTHLTGPQ